MRPVSASVFGSPRATNKASLLLVLARRLKKSFFNVFGASVVGSPSYQ